MSHFSIKTKLSLGLSLILLVAFVAINLLNYNVSRASLRQSIIDDALPGISNEIFHEIQRDLIVPIQVSSLMAHDTFLKDWILSGEKDISKIIKYLWEIKEKYNFFSTFLVSSQTKNYYHFKGLHKNISPEDDHDVWYYKFIDMGVDYALDVDTDEASRGNADHFHQPSPQRLPGQSDRGYRRRFENERSGTPTTFLPGTLSQKNLPGGQGGPHPDPFRPETDRKNEYPPPEGDR